MLLNNEIDWLKRIRVSSRSQQHCELMNEGCLILFPLVFMDVQDEVKRTSETGVEETILEGHLGVTKELLAFQTPEKKFYIGCEKGGANLIKVNGTSLHVFSLQMCVKRNLTSFVPGSVSGPCVSQELIDDFIFPASNVYLQYVKSGEFPAEQAIPVCSSPASINAGFELLVALAVGCVRNLKQIVDTLTDMYYLGRFTLFPFCTELGMFAFGVSSAVFIHPILCELWDIAYKNAV